MLKTKRNRINAGKAFILPILLVFFILGSFVFHIASRISEEMSQSAIGNLSESLNLITGMVEALYQREAEYQMLIAEELALADHPEAYLNSYHSSSTIKKFSLVYAGETEGISNTGEVFDADELDFSGGCTVEGLLVSEAYVNSMGTWAYTMVCPVKRDGREIASLYVEYIFDSFDKVLPDKLYNKSATLYFMDSKSERFVLKPKGIGDRVAVDANLESFYRANDISEPDIQKEIEKGIKSGGNVMFYHEIQKKESLIYMWGLNGGSVYLIGYVPVEAIQREGSAVNQNMFIVVVVMLAAFFICCTLYFIYEKQQEKLRLERELERETHNQQLAEALQAAQAANSSKTMFLSNMSHDIRTPMNAILGFATLLQKDADNPVKVREYTKKVAASGRHLLSLINDVLDVSKIESGKAALTIGEFTLNNMVLSVDTIIRSAAKERGQSFDVSVTGVRHERLIGDETRLNQILINLLSNSVKYTPEGGSIWLRIIGLPQRSAQYEHIRIEVEDNGFGMTPEYLNVIFDAFTRAENSTTNKVQGTGLGMAITKNIVELMGGTIEVASEVGKGSIFTVELELRIAGQEENEHFWEENGIDRILVADDDADACKNICDLMADTTVAVDVAYSGRQAVDAVLDADAKGIVYQMVLLDWKMPEMDGVETARRLRAAEKNHVPIVLLTACDWEGIEEQAFEAGIDTFLAKPFFVSTLKEKVLELRQGQSGTAQADLPQADLGGCHFLVAEDNEINAEILQELLLMEGATCEVAVNGSQAVKRFAESKPGEFDAVLMDVQMPVLNGYEATKQIRSLARADAQTIPIIAMTANAFAEDVKDAIHAGMNAHVSKPVDMEALKETIHRFVRKQEE